ncbi:MAG: M81 family metallopeptidase [Caldilineaceae bacterium]
MKIFTAVFGTETNTFSPFLTGMPNFAQTYLVHHGEHPLPPSAFAVPAVRWREMAQARGWETVESLGAPCLRASRSSGLRGTARRDSARIWKQPCLWTRCCSTCTAPWSQKRATIAKATRWPASAHWSGRTSPSAWN